MKRLRYFWVQFWFLIFTLLFTQAEAAVSAPGGVTANTSAAQGISSEERALDEAIEIILDGEIDRQDDNLVSPPPPPENGSSVETPADRVNLGFRPSAPPYLVADSGNAVVTLSWYPSLPGAQPVSGYLVYRGEDSAKPPPRPIHAEPVRELTYIDSRLNSLQAPHNRVTYYYWVRAFDIEGALSPFSNPVKAKPNGPLLPPAVVRSRSADRLVVIKWTPPISTGVFDLDRYRLYRATASGAVGEVIAEPNALEVKYEDRTVSNKKIYYYTLRSLDRSGKESGPSQEVDAAPYIAVNAPRKLTAIGLGDQIVKLKWKSAKRGGTFTLGGYNVYRSTASPVDISQSPINKLPLDAKIKTYEDSPEFSVEAPKRGTDYSYVVIALDSRGNPSAPSNESKAGPVASLSSIKNIEWKISPTSSLRINGRKLINMSFAWVKSEDRRVNTFGTGVKRGFDLIQRLQVRLQGNVGRKIKVDVDYDDNEQLDSSQQRKISIVYTGDQQEVFKEFAFGDILMDLSRTEFAGYSKSLFGAKASLESPDGKLRLTAIGAQTKGYTETKTIIGNLEEVLTGTKPGREFFDINFQQRNRFYLTRRDDLINGNLRIKPGSVKIWVDRNSLLDANSTGAVVIPNETGGSNWVFLEMRIGTDYNVDFSTGLVKFNSVIINGYSLAVSYELIDNSGVVVEKVLFDDTNPALLSPKLKSRDTTGRTDPGYILILNGKNQSIVNWDAHMAFGYYSLGNREIAIDEFFQINIMDSRRQLILALDQTNYQAYIQMDPALGELRFNSPFPFKEATPSSPAPGLFAGSNPSDIGNANSFDDNKFDGTKQDVYNLGRPNSTTNFIIEARYRYRVSNYQLRFNIVRGSEVIILDGRRLTRDADYFLDYDSGILVFNRQDMIRSNSVIEASYEYLPFAGAFNSTIWGLRGEYQLSKEWSVGTTFIRNESQKPLETPDVRSTPFSLQVLDLDMKGRMSDTMFTDLIRDIPLVGGWKVPLDVSATFEAARSWFQPNTFSQAGEKGVAMIDNFESVDNVVSTGTDEDAWSPASKPLRPDGELPDAARRFSVFQNFEGKGHDSENDVKTGQGPTRNMIRVEWAKFSVVDAWDSWNYVLSTTGMNLNEYTNLEIWIKTDTPIKLNVDVGVVSEDANGNAPVQAVRLPDKETEGVLTNELDVGIPLVGSPYPNPVTDAGLYQNPNYWGIANDFTDTEDLDGNGRLEETESFYRFSQTVSPVADPGNNDFQRINFKLKQAVGMGVGPPTTNSDSQDFFNFIKHLRIWWQSAGGSGGVFFIESIQLTGNKWKLRVNPNGTVLQQPVATDIDKFDVKAINRQINPAYVPNTDFFLTQEKLTEDREQALEISYNLDNTLINSDGRAYYMAKRLLSTRNLDFGNYRNMRLDIFKPEAIQKGELFFVRLGINDSDYYQYNIPLDDLPVGQWSTVTVRLSGSDGSRQVVGNPSLRSIHQAIIGVMNTNPPIAPRERLWINNLRVSDAEQRKGNALKAAFVYTLFQGKLRVSHDIREVGSDFIKIDTQQNVPIRHERRNFVRADSSVLSWMPMNASWERLARFTEKKRINDPLYSADYTRPDEVLDKVSGGTTFTRIPGLRIDSRASFSQSKREYLPEYKRAQRKNFSNPIDPATGKAIFEDPNSALNPDNAYQIWDVLETVDLTLPTKLWGIPPVLWPFGGDRFKAEFNYQENSTDYQNGTVLAAGFFRDASKATRTQRYRWTGKWDPIKFISLGPSFASTYIDARYYITRPDINRNPFYKLNDAGFTLDYQPQSRILNPSMNINFKNLPWGIKDPRLAYNFTVTRDYVQNTLDSRGKLEFSMNLGFGEWLKKAGFKNTFSPLSVNHSINVDSYYDNRSDPTGRNKWSTELAKKQPFIKSAWWVRSDTFTLDPTKFFITEKRTKPVETLGLDHEDERFVENIAIRSNRRARSSLRTRFYATLLPGWKVNFEPFINWEENRGMAQRSQGQTKTRFLFGSDFRVPSPALPFKKWIKPTELYIRYTQGGTTDFEALIPEENVKENVEKLTASKEITATLPMRPTKNLTVTLRHKTTLSLDTQFFFTGSGVSGIKPTRDEIFKKLNNPGVEIVYNYRMEKPFRIWSWMPFIGGRELKLTQALRLSNLFDATFTDQGITSFKDPNNPEKGTLRQDNQLPKTTIYKIRNVATYNLLKNVTMDMSIEQNWFRNNAIEGQTAAGSRGDFYSIGLKVGVEATF